MKPVAEKIIFEIARYFKENIERVARRKIFAIRGYVEEIAVVKGRDTRPARQ